MKIGDGQHDEKPAPVFRAIVRHVGATDEQLSDVAIFQCLIDRVHKIHPDIEIEVSDGTGVIHAHRED